NIKVTKGTPELLDLNYFYDVTGNIEHINDWQTGKWSAQDYSYDALDRLTTAQANSNFVGGYSQETYSYAPNGNMTSKTGVGSYTYGVQSASCPEGALNKPHAVVTAGSNTYCYDQNGAMRRRTAGGVTYTHTYDQENRLQSIVGGNFSATYSYDGDGNRVKAVVNNVTTHYPGRHYESTLSSGYTKYYFTGEQLVAFERSSGYGNHYGRRFVFRDHLGSTSLILNGAGVKLWEDRYKAYGETYYTYRKNNDSSFPQQTGYRYTGQRQEPDIGLYD
ncbi:MAG: hypothetical protein GY743_21790, partial [Planctomycetaceae bacterium]|nr:hypothetical protein [Planctomycetaceae bacterium]